MTRATTARDLEALRPRARRLLAVFAHPDDESYGPAGTLRRAGVDAEGAAVVYCLTRGEASSMGPSRGLTPDAVAALRAERLDRVADELHLDGMLKGAFPDGGLAETPLGDVGAALRAVLDAFRPQVVIAHDPRGVNAHPDHIATHWALRHALVGGPPVRFAMVAYPQEVADAVAPRLLFPTPDERVHCIVHLTPEEIDAKERCLRIHEAFVTLDAQAGDDRIVRPPLERFRFLGEAREGLVDDVFA